MGGGGTPKLPDGLTLRTGGVTRRAAYPREALSELHGVDNRARPLVPHFAAKIQPFWVRSGPFSVVHRIRWVKPAPWARAGPGALESHGESGRGGESVPKKKKRKETAENLKKGRRGPQKGVQHEDFPGGHPS